VKYFLRAWFLTFIVKVILATLLPMSADETYYWVWSHHMQLSYFDHPPFVAWLFYLGHWLEPFGNLIRLPTLILGHFTMWVWYEILKDRFAWKDFKYWYLLALSSPFVGFGSMIVTPDVPLLFFWSLSIFFFAKALQKQKALDYFLLGASLGLGFCSKYHIVLFVPLILIYLVRSRRLTEISLRKIGLTALGGLICCFPVILWNIQNEFASFRFQIHHGLGSSAWSPEWTLGYIAAEILLIFPLVFYVAMKARPPKEFAFLPYLAWGPLVFFLFSSFRGTVELNWPNAAFPAIFALVLFSPQARRTAWITATFWGALFLCALATAAFLPQGSPVAKPFREPFRFQPLATLQEKYQPLYAGTYQIASTIWYENKKPIYKLRDMSRYDFYDTLPNSLPQEDSFYVIQENWSEMPDWVKESGYTTSVVEEIEPHYIVVKVEK
jgi:4-amino-4-deoxy-L-arabinose transferase-like glycosyltransferase